MQINYKLHMEYMVAKRNKSLYLGGVMGFCTKAQNFVCKVFSVDCAKVCHLLLFIITLVSYLVKRESNNLSKL